MDEENIRSMKQHCAENLGNIQLITCDGSMDCMENPEIQEEYVAKLHLAELVCSLNILAAEGNLVLKMFTFFENSSISILYILNCCFKKVHLFKPATSKAGNSEVYLIGLGYRRNISEDILDTLVRNYANESQSLIPLSAVPDDFIQQVINCSKYFMNMQVEVIEDNIRLFRKFNKREYDRIAQLKTFLAEEFVRIYDLRPISESDKILHGLQINNEYNLNVRIHSGNSEKFF